MIAPVLLRNAVISDLHDARPAQTKTAELVVIACSKAKDDEYNSFRLRGAVTGIQRLTGKKLNPSHIDGSHLERVALGEEPLESFDDRSLFLAYRAASRRVQGIEDIRHLWVTYIGLLCLRHGIKGLDLARVPSPYAQPPADFLPVLDT